MPDPINKVLYASVKRAANQKFSTPTSAYKSGWIVQEYKRRGGRYEGQRSKGLLKRWFDEKWVNVSSSQPRAVVPCGQSHATIKGRYPVCRPTRRITAGTPTTIKELTKSQILSAIRRKQKVKQMGRIKFLVS